MKPITQYLDDIFRLLNDFSKLLNQQVSLYRFVDGKWTAIDVSNAPYYLNPCYVGVTAAYMANQLGPYAIAPSGQVGTIKLTPVFTSFNITPFPGCCGLCISTGTFVNGDYRNKGINTLGIKLREAIAGYTGYTGLVCTDAIKNAFSIRTIEKSGFRDLHTFVNKRTKNTVKLYVKPLE